MTTLEKTPFGEEKRENSDGKNKVYLKNKKSADSAALKLQTTFHVVKGPRLNTWALFLRFPQHPEIRFSRVEQPTSLR